MPPLVAAPRALVKAGAFAYFVINWRKGGYRSLENILHFVVALSGNSEYSVTTAENNNTIMSHFTVLVAGDDPSHELAPFHEFECTGLNDEFVQDVDHTAAVLSRVKEEKVSLSEALDWYGFSERTVSSESEVDKDGAHKYGFAVVKDGILLRAVKRTNPNAKWDGWCVGGRWSGYILTKDGKRCDCACKGDIDFATIRSNAETEAANEWTVVHRVIDPLPPITPWDTIQSEHSDIDKAREVYHQQPAVKAFNEWNRANAYPVGIMANVELFLVSREDYVRKKGDESFLAFAFLKDRKWVERGRMGWFACVHNEKDSATWTATFNAFLASLGDDEIVTVVDCHI